MKTFKATIHIGLGDIIYTRGQFDPVKHLYDRIEISFNKMLYGLHDDNYPIFLNDLGKLLFSEHPYVLTDADHPHLNPVDMAKEAKPCKPDLKNILCKGNSLNLGSEYIVLTTKLRYFRRNIFNSLSNELFNTIKELSNKYKIVVLGEKIIEMNNEYKFWGNNEIYSIYDDIIKNIPADKLVDLTIPALGITSPKLSQVQQDCLIMKEAKLVISLGVGGNFCMATAVANTVGYRTDNDPIANAAFDREYPDAIITKNWTYFIETLKKYL
jgi:hypothetical protein